MTLRKLATRLTASAAVLLLPLVAHAQSGLGSLKFMGPGVTVQLIIANVIKGLLGLMGSIALLMFVYSGFTWMTAAGNQEKIKKAKDTLLWSTLGLVSIFFGYAILRMILYWVR
jgi:hypothetical protein